jgi:hypothetical protein
VDYLGVGGGLAELISAIVWLGFNFAGFDQLFG